MRATVVLPLGAVLVLAAGAMVAPPTLVAQHDVEMLGRMYGTRPPPEYYDMIARDPTAYQFRTALKPWARRIMERRRRAMAAVDLDFLNRGLRGGPAARAAGPSLAAVAGTIRIPSIIFKFSNTTNPSLPDSTALANKLYSSPTPPTYSAKSYYAEISRGMLTLDGDVFGPYTVTMPDTFYEGSCNGLGPSCSNLGALLTEVLDSAEAAGVDFSPYDFDSDGLVDFVAFLHPELGAECGGAASSNIWAHRWVMVGQTGSSYSTDDGKTIDDYIIQGAVGGATGCADSTQVMPIGTFSHESGHAFNLPDLYDTSGDTDGIGHWGLMGSGNWNVQESPAHMSAWSLFTLGWIAVDTLMPSTGAPRPLTVTPVFDSDTAWAICTSSVPADCLTKEYFLLSNRTKQGSDVNVKVPAADGAGLLIWHVDQPRINARTNTNSVNVGTPPGLALEQADGQNELHTGNFGRGDTGDPWPGAMGATTFGPTTNPNSKLNDNTESNVFVDSITVQPNKSITLVLSTGVPEVVTTNREGVTDVTVDGVSSTAPVTTVWGVGTSHTIAVPDTQVATSGDERYIFQSWSDVAPPTNSHVVTATDVIPDTFTATLGRQTLLDATATAGGSVSADIGGAVTLPYWADTVDVVTVTATADVDGLFDAFTGDTTSSNTTLLLNMNRPWSVVANFLTPVVVTSTTLQNATMGFSGYSDTLAASGGTGSYGWTITGGALPQGMSLDGATGAVSGIPEESGTFTFVAKATSTGLNIMREGEDTVSITVGTPTIALSGVVDELLGSTSVLSQDELRFLDLNGNNNGRYDVGDFQAFLQSTGQASVAQTARAADEEAASPSPGEENGGPEAKGENDTNQRPQPRSRKEGV